MLNKIKLLGVEIASVTIEDCSNYIIEYPNKKEGLIQVVTANSSILVNIDHDKKLKEISQKKDTVVISDGQPIVWVSKVLGEKLPERVGGYDLFISILKKANQNKNTRLYFLGSSDSTMKKVIQILNKEYPDLKIVGYNNGFFTDKQRIFKEIEDANPDIIFVGMGSPKQEFFIDELKSLKKLNGVALGIGGSFEVFSGNLKRAPKWMQKFGLEWFYRLIQEPKRLFKRYLVTNSKFLVMAFNEIIKCKVKN